MFLFTSRFVSVLVLKILGSVWRLLEFLAFVQRANTLVPIPDSCADFGSRKPPKELPADQAVGRDVWPQQRSTEVTQFAHIQATC